MNSEQEKRKKVSTLCRDNAQCVDNMAIELTGTIPGRIREDRVPSPRFTLHTTNLRMKAHCLRGADTWAI
ncbi:hypothetical protein RB195_017500 [Necator americanus]|uniref:Uncharacterized protein n=1 Tax=Necator americanus TaxID=51031 RepID=A0ABR1C5J4_NECAM